MRKHEIVILSMCFACLLWIIASYIDVNAHNMTDHEFSSWNFFNFLVKSCSDEKNAYAAEEDYISSTQQTKSVSIAKPTKEPQPTKKVVVKKQKKVNQRDLLNLARIIQAENGGHKDDEALIMTGVVVLKRVKSKHYPDTIIGVISQKGQYSTYADGKFWNEPSKRSMKIAKKLLTTDLADEYPDNLVFQAEFSQGKRVYKKLGFEYFCLA